jgi:hypothetical protein
MIILKNYHLLQGMEELTSMVIVWGSQIFAGEIVVFLHGGRLVKIARASSSVISPDNGLPPHFTIDIESIHAPRRMLRISEFQEILFKVAGLATNLASKNWNHLQDSDVLISIIDRL